MNKLLMDITEHLGLFTYVHISGQILRNKIAGLSEMCVLYFNKETSPGTYVY